MKLVESLTWLTLAAVVASSLVIAFIWPIA